MIVDTTQFVFSLKRQGLEIRTIEVIMSHLNSLIRYLTEYSLPFTLDSYHKFIDSKINTVSHASINKYAQATKKYCEFMGLEWGANIQKLREQPKKRYLMSDEEIMTFLEIDTPYTLFWSILAFTGARPGEIRSLTTDNIDPINKCITFEKTKTGTGRTIPLNSLICDKVITYSSNREDKLFIFTETAYNKDFKKRLKILGIKKNVQPYSLRHSYITRMLTESDAGLFQVQDLVGHTDPKTTRKYYHGNLKLLHKAIKKDPLLKDSLSDDDLFAMFVKDVEKVVESYNKTFSISTKKTDDRYVLDIAIKHEILDIRTNASKKTETNTKKTIKRKISTNQEKSGH